MMDENTAKLMNISIRARLAGCEVTLTFDAEESGIKDRLKAVLEQLSELGIDKLEDDAGSLADAQGDGKENNHHGDDPYSLLQRESELDATALKTLIGIKNDSVQVYKVGQYPPSVAATILCLVYEKGLGHASMSFETFSTLLEANHLKMKTPLSNFCFNLQRDGTIDKRAYDNGRVIVLTPAGEKKAIEALRTAASGGNAHQKKK